MLGPVSANLHHRNMLLGVSWDGLNLEIDGNRKQAPWSAVVGISAGRRPLDPASGAWIIALAIEVDVEDHFCLFILSEVEPAWLAVTAILPTILPDVLPFEVWGADLVGGTDVVDLYEREATA